jgi:hypothetical protein
MTEEEKVRILFHCILEISQSCRMRGCPQLSPSAECWCMKDAQTIYSALEMRGLDIVYRANLEGASSQ